MTASSQWATENLEEQPVTSWKYLKNVIIRIEKRISIRESVQSFPSSTLKNRNVSRVMCLNRVPINISDSRHIGKGKLKINLFRKQKREIQYNIKKTGWEIGIEHVSHFDPENQNSEHDVTHIREEHKFKG